MTNWLSVVVFLIGLLWQVDAAPLVLDGTECCDTRSELTVLSDMSGTLTLQDVINKRQAFGPAKPGMSYGYQQGAVWLHLTVMAPQQGEWWWLLHYPSLDRADLYIEDSRGWRHLVTGDTVPLSERALLHRQLVFPLSLLPGEKSHLWLRVESEGSLTLTNEILSGSELIQYTRLAYLGPALYFGILLALASYNFLLFLVLRETVFLWYVLFVSFFGIAAAALNGLGPLFLWPYWLEFGNRMLPLGFTAASLMAVLFTRSFLDTARFSPGWDRWLKRLIGLKLLAVVAVSIIPVRTSLVIMSLIGILLVLTLLICAVQGLRNKAPGALLFTLAWAMLIIGISIMSLRNLGLLPSNFLTVHALQLGSAVEMVLISFGLAARFNRLKLQHSQMQQQMLDRAHQHEAVLEQKVRQRTQELEEANIRLRQLASTDSLTGLANRNAMFQHLQQAIQRARRQQHNLALLYLDLDGFKAVNDKLGHHVGDALLTEVSNRLKTVVRGSDLLCRIGGDEFLIICEDLPQGEQLEELTKRLLLQMQLPFLVAGQQLQIGASIGVAISQSGGSEASQLIEAADHAMYQAKAAGKNQVRQTSVFA